MLWIVQLADEFVPEFRSLDRRVRIELAAHAVLLEQFGPQLRRPRVDTLHGSKYANMKEMRFKTQGQPWRVAFAFDSGRTAVLLAAGSKSGMSQSRFYRTLIRKADCRFGAHLERLARERDGVHL